MKKMGPAEWQQIFALLDTALDLPMDQRDTWLDSLDENQVQLKPALREMLAKHAAHETSDYLQALPQFTRIESNEPSVATALSASDEIGPYRLLRELGRGGMGTVWLAERIDGKLKRQVALKLPHLSWALPDLAARMARERDILATLEHPNIARLYDADVTPLGQPYLVLEYVDGVPIDEYCDRHRLNIRERLVLFLQVLNAVHYAHSHLIVHRDLKPSNILITGDRVARLLDFGIAKLVSETDAHDGALTQFGGRALTPDYASPEQIGGRPITTASDIYSLGVILYELLCGSRPYRLKRDSRASLEDAVLEANVIPPSRAVNSLDVAGSRSATTRQLVRTLRGDLETVVLKSMQKDLSFRFGSIEAFKQDIERYLDGRPVSARAASPWYRAKRFVGRNAVAAAAAGIVALALLSGSGVALWQARVANQERNKALTHAYRNEVIAAFLNTVITDVTRTGKPISTLQMLERSEHLARQEFASKPEYLAAVLEIIADNYKTSGDFEKARALFAEALSKIPADEDEMRAGAACHYGHVVSRLEGIDAGSKIIHETLASERIGPSIRAICLRYLAYIAQDVSDGASALKYAQLALDAARNTRMLLPEVEASLEADVAYGHYLANDSAQADQHYKAALVTYDQLGLGRSPSTLTIRSNWSLVLIAMGNPHRALEQYDLILDIVREDDPTAQPPPHFVGNRANVLEALGRYSEATVAYRECSKIAGELENKRWLALCFGGLASVAREQGELEAADKYLGQISALGNAAPEGSSADRRRKLTEGRIALARGQTEQAIAIFSAMKSVRSTYDVQLGLAEAYLLQGKAEEAAINAQEALAAATQRKANARYSAAVGLSQFRLGQVRAYQGKPAEALEAFRIAEENLENTVDHSHPVLVRARERLQ